MEILGMRVRAYRKAKGMSQNDLAKNICTQATISLIEKRNKIPSMPILLRITARLGITIDDIIVEEDGQIAQIFRKIGSDLHAGHYRNAEKKLNTIKFKSLNEVDEKKAYYYYHGELQLINHVSPDEAIFSFSMLLDTFGTRVKDMYKVMGKLGLGLAYDKKGDPDKAIMLIDQALEALDGFEVNSHDQVVDQVYTLSRAARFFQRTNKHERALKLLKRAIKLNETHHCIFLLEDLYESKAVSQLELADRENAQQSLYIAYSLAMVTKNPRRIASIADNAQKYQIPPLSLVSQ